MSKSKSDPCWEGYEAIGMKTKNGKQVPNCVPKKRGEAKERAQARKGELSTPLPPPIVVPEGFNIPAPTLSLPDYKHPQWQPVPIYREDVPALKKKDETKSARRVQQRCAQAADPAPALPKFEEVRSITIPVINKEIPVPEPEILVTAVSTAGVASVASVGATLAATSLFKRVMQLAKPVTKIIVKKLAKVRKKPAPLTGRARGDWNDVVADDREAGARPDHEALLVDVEALLDPHQLIAEGFLLQLLAGQGLAGFNTAAIERKGKADLPAVVAVARITAVEVFALQVVRRHADHAAVA